VDDRKKKVKRERTTNRVRKHRRHKAAEQQTPTQVFNSAQALGEAQSRVKRNKNIDTKR